MIPEQLLYFTMFHGISSGAFETSIWPTRERREIIFSRRKKRSRASVRAVSTTLLTQTAIPAEVLGLVAWGKKVTLNVRKNLVTSN